MSLVHPVLCGALHQSAENEQFHVLLKSESDLQSLGPSQDGEYCRKLSVLFVLARPCKYNIYKNIEGKADIPPFQCINSDVQK